LKLKFIIIVQEDETVDLKEAIDLQDLMNPGKGAYFEVEVKEEPEKDLSNDYFKAEDVYKNILTIDDETADLCEKEGLDHFEAMAKRMEDITEEKDGGVLKKVMIVTRRKNTEVRVWPTQR
jgi:hypothetical protein